MHETRQSAQQAISRRALLASTAGMCVSALGARMAMAGPPYDDPVARFPEKTALRLLNDRAPQLETPWRYFKEDLTPNEAMFVRWHLQPIPTHVDLNTWTLRVGGHVNETLSLSMDDIRAMPAQEFVAVIQCSGNSRRYFAPRVPGGQWGDGAMANVRWKGVRLSDVLERAGMKSGAVQVTFNGLDTGPLPATPDFVKALDVDHAMQPEILLAYEMNGAELPLLNGFPMRLIVPGWYATYWVKCLSEITVSDTKFDGFWMAKAYHIPDNANASETPNDLAKNTVPINRFNTRSFWVHPSEKTDETVFPSGATIPLEGVAFDGGSGIASVEYSLDGGGTWQEATLGDDMGGYAFRRWRAEWTPTTPGTYQLKVRATSNDGETQPDDAKWNHGGYMRNVIETVDVTITGLEDG